MMPRRDSLAVAALVAFFALVFVAAYGERIAPNEQIYFVIEHGRDPRPYEPGLVFPFGSDVLGRDLFSVVLAGARATLTIIALAGLARVLAGVVVAAVSAWWRPTRVLVETVADVAAAVPATLVAVLLIKAFVRTDTTVALVVGTLLLVGWAGPYRVLRTEIDRLARAPFTEGAQVIGVSRARLFWRHHVPHLVPVMAINLSQQVVASLVLLAELGVLGVVLSAVRFLDVSDSLSIIRFGPPVSAPIPEIPEWGALLASARSVEILWATRWVIFVPGAAFAITAACVALIGFAIARRYARRDIYSDVRPGLAIAGCAAVLIASSGLVPERYADAREWAADARSYLAESDDTAAAFASAGLKTATVTRSATVIRRIGQATVSVAGVTVDEEYRTPSDLPKQVHVRSVVSGDLGGGGTVEAPLVYVGRGIVPSEHPAAEVPSLRYLANRGPGARDLQPLLVDYPDDYAGVDVRGKIVVVVRFIGIDTLIRGRAAGWTAGSSIHGALDRGAAGVILIDNDAGAPGGAALELSPALAATNPYAIIEKQFPARTHVGVPVIVMDLIGAKRLLSPIGIDVAPFMDWDRIDVKPTRSTSRELGVNARISVPLKSETTSYTSLVAEVQGAQEEAGRIVIWTRRDLGHTDVELQNRDVLTSIARFAASRRAPFIFVEYDPRADTEAIREYLADRRVLLVLVLDRFDGGQLAFYTSNGDLIPAMNLYAEKARASYDLTRRTLLAIQQVGQPLPEFKTVVMSSYGGTGDRRADAVAFVGYLAGRLELGAPELGR
jgi:peptide/nickel transport system permease protein